MMLLYHSRPEWQYSTIVLHSSGQLLVAILAGSGTIHSMIKSIQPTDRKVQAQYLLDGVLVTICKPARPRRSERTWSAGAKYSVANLGAKAATLRNVGLSHAKG
jgi:hypothetical protein